MNDQIPTRLGNKLIDCDYHRLICWFQIHQGLDPLPLHNDGFFNDDYRLYKPEIYHRRSIRLKNYDYNQSGAYFITICVQNRECLLGEIQNSNTQLNLFGDIVKQIWYQLPNHFPNVEIDAAVIMPNHFHGIILITPCRGLVSKPSVSKSDETQIFYLKKQNLEK